VTQKSTTFPYMIKYKQVKKSIVDDALLRRYVLLPILNAMMLGFEYVKELYMNDSDFANVYHTCKNLAFGKLYRIDGYFF